MPDQADQDVANNVIKSDIIKNCLQTAEKSVTFNAYGEKGTSLEIQSETII